MAVTDKTKSMMSLLPSWMKMAKDEESVGAKFLDVFGAEIQDIEDYLDGIWNDMYIDSINLQQAEFCYKVPIARRDVIDQQYAASVTVTINEEVVACMPQDTLRQFYNAEEESFMVDTLDGYIYVKASNEHMKDNIFKPFQAINVNGTMHYEYMLHHIWNTFDEFGMLLNLYRLPGERNERFKDRILQVFKDPAGADKDGLVTGISRELGIQKHDVEIGSFTDDDYVYTELVDNEGVPTEKYLKYIDQVNSNLGFTWDKMNWGEAYWRSLEEDNMGFHYLPHIWDGFSPEWKDSDIVSGVGSGEDLKVTAPQEEPSVREFKTYVGLHGTQEQVEELNPELQFKYKIVAKGKVPNTEYPMETYKHTINASEIIPLHYILTAMKEFIYKTEIVWDNRYGYTFKDNASPKMEIVTGESILSNKKDRHLKVHADLKTSDNTVTPALQELIVNWTATDETVHDFKMTTDEDFSSHTPMVTTEMRHIEIRNNEVAISRGSFAGIIDTHGSFLKGAESPSVLINRNGSLTLDLPK